MKGRWAVGRSQELRSIELRADALGQVLEGSPRPASSREGAEGEVAKCLTSENRGKKAQPGCSAPAAWRLLALPVWEPGMTWSLAPRVDLHCGPAVH
ncbi:Ribosome-Binding Protein 1 [Manis pentadactyla]|nr:Ribosome-Binding Protein 1 [Manis pentadactyla]